MPLNEKNIKLECPGKPLSQANHDLTQHKPLSNIRVFHKPNGS